MKNEITKDTNPLDQINKNVSTLNSIDESEFKTNNIIPLIAISGTLKMCSETLKQLKTFTLGSVEFNTLKWGLIMFVSAFLISLLSYRVKKLDNNLIKIMFVLISNSLLLYGVYMKVDGFIFRSFCNMTLLILSFKAYSYLIRISIKNSNSEKVSIENSNSEKVSIKNSKAEKVPIEDFNHFVAFMFSPAIFYRPDYNRIEKRNYKKAIKSFLKSGIYYILMSFVFHNIAIPILSNLLSSSSRIMILENFLFLNISVIMLFNLFFKVVFDSFFVFLNEMTRMEVTGYKNWWNAKDSSEFWRYWNVPMHVFIKEHVYLPLLERNINKHLCRIICLIFSGGFHELVISLALKRVSGWFFLAMMLQDPLLYVTYYFKQYFPNYSNYFFLICFCVLGQTIGFILLLRGEILIR